MLDAFRKTAVARLSLDRRILGVLMTGSLASGAADRFSDLDLVVVVSPDDNASMMADRRAIAAGLGDLLSCFTGEHVGEPRLLICLYKVDGGDGVIHVDLKVITPDDLAARVDEPIVLY
ncbi:MAG TPA: nucleotidyltransferase domain-containing protein, partial [Brevundimonas sp.]|nr:nucleotidyltransferase domain-containing protein [Brevundimonas sp.]